MQLAQEKAGQLVECEVLVEQAKLRAQEVIRQVQADAENIRSDADEYVMRSLTQLSAELERISNQVTNGIRVVQDEQERRASAAAAEKSA